jgi:hypothetical protein
MDVWANAWESQPAGVKGNFQTLARIPREDTMRYDQWRSKQHADVLDRGRSVVNDFGDEEQYIQRMIKTVLRSHICYREVDEYAACLLKHKLISDRDLASKGLVDVNLRLAQDKCARAVSKYTACLEARANHDTVVSSATTHARCEPKRKDFLICLRKWNASPTLQERNCYYSEYFPLLRCGLNALFDEYWKSVTNYSPANELHQFELETDSAVKRGVSELRARLEMETMIDHEAGRR